MARYPEIRRTVTSLARILALAILVVVLFTTVLLGAAVLGGQMGATAAGPDDPRAQFLPLVSQRTSDIPPPTPIVQKPQTIYTETFVYGDARPDAPELARRGNYKVGVRTVTVVNPNQIDILKYTAANPNPLYDRPLKLEIWYPAIIPPDQRELATYSDVLGSGPGNPARPLRPFEFLGRSLREAAPDPSGGPYPLLIVSHGYPGSRVLMTYLAENIASKGYVVVAIDHTESTHADKVGFSSTLLNRPLDDLFVLNKMAEFGAAGSGNFLAGLVDANRTAVAGYSMGGYGALIAAGAGVTEAAVNYSWGVPGGHLAIFQAGTPAYTAWLDPRIKAIIALAPWGGGGGLLGCRRSQGVEGTGALHPGRSGHHGRLQERRQAHVPRTGKLRPLHARLPER